MKEQYQRTLIWENGLWKLKWEAMLPYADVEPTEQQPADPWTRTWYKSTAPPYIIWERWLWTWLPSDKGPNYWWMAQQTRNW